MFSVFATSAQLTRVVLSEQVGVGVGGTNGGQKEGLAHFLSSSHQLPGNSHTRQAAKSLPATTSTSSTSQLMSLLLSFPFFLHIDESFDDFFRSSE